MAWFGRKEAFLPNPCFAHWLLLQPQACCFPTRSLSPALALCENKRRKQQLPCPPWDPVLRVMGSQALLLGPTAAGPGCAPGYFRFPGLRSVDRGWKGHKVGPTPCSSCLPNWVGLRVKPPPPGRSHMPLRALPAGLPREPQGGTGPARLLCGRVHLSQLGRSEPRSHSEGGWLLSLRSPKGRLRPLGAPF